MRLAIETAADRLAVRAINTAAFGRDDEANLVEDLHADGDVCLSLVAFCDKRPAGHILFSRLNLRVNGRPVRSVALAPMAVLPGHQRQGIGSTLIKEGIARLREQGVEAILVLGHENYYPRFGFNHRLVSQIECPFTDYQAFMGMELVPGALMGEPGICTYAKAFGLN